MKLNRSRLLNTYLFSMLSLFRNTFTMVSTIRLFVCSPIQSFILFTVQVWFGRSAILVLSFHAAKTISSCSTLSTTRLIRRSTPIPSASPSTSEATSPSPEATRGSSLSPPLTPLLSRRRQIRWSPYSFISRMLVVA